MYFAALVDAKVRKSKHRVPLNLTKIDDFPPARPLPLLKNSPAKKEANEAAGQQGGVQEGRAIAAPTERIQQPGRMLAAKIIFAKQQIQNEGGILVEHFDPTMLNILFTKSKARYKATIMREHLSEKRIKLFPEHSAIALAAEKVLVCSEDLQSDEGWAVGRTYNHHDVTIFVKDSRQIEAFKEGPFYTGLRSLHQKVENSNPVQASDPASSYSQSCRIFHNAPIKTDNSPEKIEAADDQYAEQDKEVRFPSETPPERTEEAEKIKTLIKSVTPEEKIVILNDIYKIRRKYKSNQRTRTSFLCPVHLCSKQYHTPDQLRVHLNSKHHYLADHGIILSEANSMEYSDKAMNLILFLGKMYPLEMKKILKMTKTPNI